MSVTVTAVGSGIRLPTDKDVSEMLQTLLSLEVVATPVSSAASTAAYGLSLHVDPDGVLLGGVASDISFTADTAFAIAGRDPKRVDEVIYSGSVGLDLWDNFREVSNVMNVLFTDDRHPRVILHSAQRVELPLWSRLQHSDAESVSFEVTIQGYPAGGITIFSFSDRDDQSLLDRLAAAGTEAATHDTQVVGGKLIRPFDFHKPKGVERAQLNALRTNLSNYTKSAAAIMTEVLQSAVHIKLVQLHHQNWDDYAGTLDNNAFITTFKLNPLPSQFVLTFSPGLSMKCLDCRLSGGAIPGSIHHTLTDLDVALLQPVVSSVIDELAQSFSTFVPVEPHVIRHVTEKFMMEGVTLSLTWLVAWMTVSVGGSTFDASLCFPIVPLQPVLTAMAEAAQFGESDVQGGDPAPLGPVVPEVETGIAVHFPSVPVPFEELAALQPGTVVPLGQETAAPLLLSARGRPLALVTPTVRGHRLAAEVVELIEDPETLLLG